MLALLRAAGAEVQVVDYLADPPTPADLARLYAAAAAALNNASDEAILAAMAADPILIERPLVETPRGVRLCRPPDRVNEIL